MSKKKIKIVTSSVGYDLSAVIYDQKEKYLNSFEQSFISDFIGDITNKKVLDIGAGTGRIAGLLVKRGAEVTALDVSNQMLKQLQKKYPQVNTVVGEAENLPLANDSFDLLVANFLIVHLKDLKYFFHECYRVLKDNGRLILTNINQKEPPEIKIGNELIKIESYYHRPEKVINELNDALFTVDIEQFVYENNVWINQIIVARR